MKVVNSTMRDTYKWTSSEMFNQRKEILEERPNLQKDIDANPRLRFYNNTSTVSQLPNCRTNPYEMNIIDNGHNNTNGKQY